MWKEAVVELGAVLLGSYFLALLGDNSSVVPPASLLGVGSCGLWIICQRDPRKTGLPLKQGISQNEYRKR